MAEIVDGCVDTYENPKPAWRPRKEAYVERMETAPASVQLVSAADKLHNARSIFTDLRSLGDDLWDRFTGGKSGTLWYYRALVEAYTAERASLVVEELDRVVQEIEALANRIETEERR